MSIAATLASDPTVLACFDRVCAAVVANRSGITIRQLSTAHALARALVARDDEKAATFAQELGLDVEAVR